ncbi:DUF1801 domain-containing protein [Spirosoma sp. KUDC1026]|uniref:DUF1801 domain-containing protein n=1 Tax=Spirosoma sp. KUDC1026 TaxID=2745947 RepID=UPI00293BDB16|nr:DUF1801 domain-containing protein [Spirosoma sp. KUDC1026]
MNPKADFHFDKDQKWQQELSKLRTILLDCQLTEELKWGVPCYTYRKSNVVLVHVFKEYCALLFIKGALLQYFDSANRECAGGASDSVYQYTTDS